MNKVVLITGSSSGIGKATAIAFASKGWTVIATSRHVEAKDFKDHPTVHIYDMDVTSASEVASVFKAVLEKFGNIDVVINNAGYGLDGVFESMSDADIRKLFDTNVFGLMIVTREAVEAMRPKRKGTIIQIASMGGRVAFPLYSVYHSSKWAVEGFSESLQFELRPLGIKVKVIEPGVIRTPFYQANRVFVRPAHKLGYDEVVRKIEEVSQKAAKKGETPDVVARVILKAAEDSSSKFRYIVGSPAPILLGLRKILPDRLFFYGIRKNFKL